MKYLTIWDAILPLLYVPLLIVIANSIQKKNIKKNPVYKYYTKGATVKIFGAIAICLIYALYYGGGDTLEYFRSTNCLVNLAGKNPSAFLEIVISGPTWENYSYFNEDTGYPGYWFDKHAYYLCLTVFPFLVLSFGSFITSTVLFAFFCYSGIWKLFLLFSEEFKPVQKQLAIAILFIPSVVFWGSGLLKDTLTLSAVGWYTYAFYNFFIKKKLGWYFGFTLFISAYIIIVIKPYIFFALLPGSVVWLSITATSKIKSKIIKGMVIPFSLIIGTVGGFFALKQMEGFLGIYKIDTVLERAAIVQQDQKKAYYGGNSFDIGNFDPTMEGVSGKVHLAIAAALFRPYLWEVKNVVMLFSAIENMYILLLTIFLLIKLKIFGVFSLIAKHHLLFFSISFSLFFAFSVGLSTSNFGSLVRLKIPGIPFYVASLFILKYFYEQKSKKKLGI